MHIKKKLTYQEAPRLRLDKYLAQTFPDIPRKFFQKQISQGQVLVNEKKVQPDFLLTTADLIDLQIHYETAPTKPEPQAGIDFKVVFQNENFLVIDKPAGLSVHPSIKEKSHTLVNGLLFQFPQITDVGEDQLRPGIVHRLDKDTSGLMLVALNQKTFSYLKKLFQEHQIEKRYLALVWGKLKNKQGKIESYIGRSKSNPLKQSSSPDPGKITNPKKAITSYQILQETEEKSLIEARPRTGRMHQIRIHFHSLGHPLVGDKKYQTKLVKEKNKKYSRHLLHAAELKFTYLDKKEYLFTSQPPEEFSLS